MKPRHKRLALISGLVVAVGAVTALVVNAFHTNLIFFYSPSQVLAKEAPLNRTFRLGGLVEEGSVKREGVTVNFQITDTGKEVTHEIAREIERSAEEEEAWKKQT